jgi:hypothetical protein
VKPPSPWLLEAIKGGQGKSLCPFNGADCGWKCFVRDACTNQPDDLAAYLDRIDPLTEAALSQVINQF